MRYRKIKNALQMDPFIHRVSIITSLVYGIIYYWTAGYIALNPGTSSGVMWVEDIQGLMWQMRGPFQWEAIALFSLPKFVHIWLSVPNILVAITLVFLVCSNLVLILIAFRHPRICKIRKGRKSHSFIALLPALFTGFSCCAPTAIILWVSLFGSVSSVMLTALRWFLPLGLVMLTFGIIAGYRSIPIASEGTTHI